MSNSRRNDNTIFHELGHKLSLRHAVGSVDNGGAPLYAGAAHAANGTDVTGNGANDSVGAVSSVTFLIEGTAHTMARGSLSGGHTVLNDEGPGWFVNGAVTANTHAAVLGMDSFGGTSNAAIILEGGGGFPAGTGFNWSSNIFFPTLMDGTDYPIVNGENLQNNLTGPQFTVNGNVQNTEIRIRSVE